MATGKSRGAKAARRDRKVIVIGFGGHAKVLIDCLQLMNKSIMGAVDKDAKLKGRSFAGVAVIGNDGEIGKHSKDDVWLVNAVGSTSSVALRREVYDRFTAKGYEFLAVVHPSAVIARDVRLGEGAQVMAGAVIQPGSSIGDNSIVNTRTSVDHECRIGAHVHLSPGCTISGAVHIEDEAHLGTSSTVIQSIHIGAQCLIAAGAVVVRDVPSGTRVKGVPAKAFPNKRKIKPGAQADRGE